MYEGRLMWMSFGECSTDAFYFCSDVKGLSGIRTALEIFQASVFTAWSK